VISKKQLDSIAILDLHNSQLIEDVSASSSVAITGGTVATFIQPKKPITLGGTGIKPVNIPPQVISAYRCPDGTIVTYCSDGSSTTPPPGLCPGSQAI
jgi:hypothetical protein